MPAFDFSRSRTRLPLNAAKVAESADDLSDLDIPEPSAFALSSSRQARPMPFHFSSTPEYQSGPSSRGQVAHGTQPTASQAQTFGSRARESAPNSQAFPVRTPQSSQRRKRNFDFDDDSDDEPQIRKPERRPERWQQSDGDKENSIQEAVAHVPRRTKYHGTCELMTKGEEDVVPRAHLSSQPSKQSSPRCDANQSFPQGLRSSSVSLQKSTLDLSPPLRSESTTRGQDAPAGFGFHLHEDRAGCSTIGSCDSSQTIADGAQRSRRTTQMDDTCQPLLNPSSQQPSINELQAERHGTNKQKPLQSISPTRQEHANPEVRNLFDLLSHRQRAASSSQLSTSRPPIEREPSPPLPRERRSIPGPACDQMAQDGVSAISAAAVAATGTDDLGPIPTLPLRKKRTGTDRNDAEFQSFPWVKMLQDLDVISDAAEGCRLEKILESCQFRTPIAKVLREAFLKKVPRMVVLVKSINVGDDSADAVIQDPTGEMRATVHGKVLEEEGEDLARGSGLVLRKVTVFNSFNGLSHLAVITPNNVVRCYPPTA